MAKVKRDKTWWDAQKQAMIERDPQFKGLDIIDRRFKGKCPTTKFNAQVLWTMRKFLLDMQQETHKAGFDLMAATAEDCCDYAERSMLNRRARREVPQAQAGEHQDAEDQA